jgi:hypothetical protein
MMASRKVPVWVSAEQAVWSAATTQPLFGNLDAWPRSVSSTTADQVRSTWGSPIRMSPDPHTSLAFDHDAIVAVAVAAARQAYVTGPDPFGLPVRSSPSTDCTSNTPPYFAAGRHARTPFGSGWRTSSSTPAG